MTGPKTNERPGTRATLRGYHMSASKARVVLNLVRGVDVNTAREILAGTTREAADVIGKVLASAVANAVNNDGMVADELYVSAAYADEGVTLKRFSPRARGRAGQIRKRACHITVIVSRLDEDRLEIVRSARSAQAAASRTRRVASSRRRPDQPTSSVTPSSVVPDVTSTETPAVIESDVVQSENVNATVDEVHQPESATNEVIDGDVTTDEVEETTVTPDATRETVSADTTEETNK